MDLKLQAKVALEGAMEAMQANINDLEERLGEVRRKAEQCQETSFLLWDLSSQRQVLLDDTGDTAFLGFTKEQCAAILAKRQARLEAEAGKIQGLVRERKTEMEGITEQLKHIDNLGQTSS